LQNRISFLLVFCVFCVATASAQFEGQSNFSRFNFNAGGGWGAGRGDVGSFVGTSYQGVAGAGMNFSRMFGFNAEYMYYGLGIRQSVSETQSLNNTSGSLNAVTLNGIVNAPLHSRWGAYGIFGVGFYRRSVSSSTGPLATGSLCQPSWVWWDVACSGIPPVTLPGQTLGTLSKDAGGFNFGGGLTYRLNHLHHAKIYFEGRYHRAYTSDVETAVMPFTFGLRW